MTSTTTWLLMPLALSLIEILPVLEPVPKPTVNAFAQPLVAKGGPKFKLEVPGQATPPGKMLA